MSTEHEIILLVESITATYVHVKFYSIPVYTYIVRVALVGPFLHQVSYSHGNQYCGYFVAMVVTYLM